MVIHGLGYFSILGKRKSRNISAWKDHAILHGKPFGNALFVQLFKKSSMLTRVF